MSDTPRTDGCLTEILDAYGYVHQGNCPQRWVNHARELERELSAANEKAQRYHEHILKHKAENQHLTDKIQQLYEGAEEQKQTIKELEEVNEYLRQKNDKLEYGRTSK